MAGVGGTDARNPMRQTFGCCARAASGHVATVPPTRVMNSRRLMCPQIEGLNLPYRRGAETALCNTAKLGGWGPSRVIRVDRASDESPLVPRFQTCQAAVRFVAMCHK